MLIKYYSLILSIVAVFQLFVPSSLFAKDDSTLYCITYNKSTGQIEYNQKGRNCIMFKNIDSSIQNTITAKAAEGMKIDGSCLLTESNSTFPNAQSLAGTTIWNGSTKSINCNKGYKGDIKIKCTDGVVSSIGSDNACTFNGCNKSDNEYNAILNSSQIVWEYVTKTQSAVRETNADANYENGDKIDELTCRDNRIGYELVNSISEGYTITCKGNNNFVLSGNGCIYDQVYCFGAPKPSNSSISFFGDESIKSAGDSYMVKNGSKVDYECKTGYKELTDDGSEDNSGHYAECVHNSGTRTSDWIERGKCEIVKCPISDLIDSTNNFLDNNTRTISICTDKTCNGFSEILNVYNDVNGYVEYNNYITINDCIDGYKLDGEKSKRILYCNEEGKWETYSNGDKICEIVKCNMNDLISDNEHLATLKVYSDDNCNSAVGKILNADSDDVCYNTKVVPASCDTGYNLNNEKIFSCNKDGVWEVEGVISSNADGTDGTNIDDNVCSIVTCPLSSINELNLSSYGLFKSVSLCSNDNCNSITERIELTSSNKEEKSFEYEDKLMLGCMRGYGMIDPVILNCNADGELEFYSAGVGTCEFVGCNDSSPVYDVNNNKMSDQLAQMTFGSIFWFNNASHEIRIYPVNYCGYAVCDDYDCDMLSVTEVNTIKNNFVANAKEVAFCSNSLDSVNMNIKIDVNRLYTCTNDSSVYSGGSYWKMNVASCDLTPLKNPDKGYKAYLSDITVNTRAYSTGKLFNDDCGVILVENKKTQYRYPAKILAELYINRRSDFGISCKDDGTWDIRLESRTCKGLPDTSLIPGSKFYYDDYTIKYVGGEDHDGMVISMKNLSQVASEKMKKSESNDYFAINGTKIEASCKDGYKELDKNGINDANDANYDKGGHYYECVNGTWTARGNCSHCGALPTFDKYSQLYTVNSGKFQYLNGDEETGKIILGSDPTTLLSNGEITATALLAGLSDGTYHAQIGTKLDMNCNNDGTEFNEDGKRVGQEGYGKGFYYECNSNGVWQARGYCKGRCGALPTFDQYSQLHSYDGKFQYVDDDNETSGISSGSTTLSNGAITTDALLSGLSDGTYRAIHGTKLDMNCNADGDGATEVDDNNKTSKDTEYIKGLHYYECNNGSWVKHGSCKSE